MSKTRILIVALAAAFALPVAAQQAGPSSAAGSGKSPAGVSVYTGDEAGWAVNPYRYFEDEEHNDTFGTAARRAAQYRPSPKAIVQTSKDWKYVGGEGVWEVAQHKYVFNGGELVHSEECDHAIRTVKAATPIDIERMNLFSPG